MSTYDHIQNFLILGLLFHTLTVTRRVRRLEGDARHYGGGRK